MSQAQHPVIRTPGDVETLRRKDSGKWNRFGKEPLAAWVADMDFELAEPIHAYLQERIDLHDIGYPQKVDTSPLARIYSERMQRRFQWQPDPSMVEVITDVVQGIYLVLLNMSSENDKIVVQTPIYPPFLNSVNETGRRLALNPLIPTDSGWAIDFDDLERQMEGASWLLLCNPHNPSGRVYTRAELERIGELATRYDVRVLADEIHMDLTFDGRRYIPFASLGEDLAKRTVTMTSATKSFNTAGLRCAVAHFGTETMRAQFNATPARVRGGLATFAVAVTCIAWEQCDDWLDAVIETLQGNRELLREFLTQQMPAVDYVPQEGTYLAWLDFNRYRAAGAGNDPLGENPADYFLEHAKIALSPGPDFGPQGKGCVRLNFATSPEILSQILNRLRDGLPR